MVIGAYVIQFVVELIGGVIAVVAIFAGITYGVRGLFWLGKIFWKDQVNWLEGELKRAWNDRPFQRRPRRPYFPTEVEEEVERRLKFRLQQMLDESREQDRPRQSGRDIDEGDNEDGKAGRKTGGKGHEGDDAHGGGSQEGVG